jgi:hypothetical protein
VELLPMAMAGASEVMEAQVIRFGGHVFIGFGFVGFLAHA